MNQLYTYICISCFRHVQLFVTRLTMSSVHGVLQARIHKWVAMPPPGDLSDPGTEPSSFPSPALAAGFFTTSATWDIATLF